MQYIIHRKEDRGTKDIGWLISKFSFSFSSYYHPLKNGFGLLITFNDDIVKPGGGFGLHPHVNMEIISVMLQGKMNHKDTMGFSEVVEKDWVQIMSAGSGLKHEEHNVGDEDVNFLQIWIRAGKTKIPGARQLVTYNDVNENLNSLVKVIPVNGHNAQLPFIVSIGKFSGRGETVYLPKNKKNALFVFVIEGAFEVEGRLLHARDGLGLWETGVVEMEALSNDAILLVAEHPL